MQLARLVRPVDWYSDNNSDLDLGSGAPALLPNGLVFEVGKSQTAYVLNQSDLGRRRRPGGVDARISAARPDGGSADLNGTLFVPCSDGSMP